MEMPLFDRMHKTIESLFWALGVDFLLLVVNLRRLSVNSGPGGGVFSMHFKVYGKTDSFYLLLSVSKRNFELLCF